MSLPSLSVSRPVAVAMLFLAIALLGIVSLSRLPVDVLPDVAYPQLVVYTRDTGAAPVEVERFITEPIERQVAAVPGVQRVESITREGVSLVVLRFAWRTDMEFAALNVRERLDALRGTLPPLASTPAVLRTDPRSEPVMVLSVSAPTDLRALKELTEQVFKRRLEQLEGVAQAAVTGGLEREIQVEVDPGRLESQGVTIEQIAAALDAANVSAPGGTILQGRSRYALRTLGEFRSPSEIGEVVVRAGDGAGAGGGGPGASAEMSGPTAGARRGATVTLADVATVTDGVRERTSIARHDGAEAVGVLVFKTAGANTVRVAERVEDTLDELRAEYPGVTLAVASSEAGFIADSISNVLQALLLGGLLAFLVLFVFLRDVRYPVAIAVAIPISVVGSFALLELAGVSLNIMSLGGLALGVGMLVDNSIVVLENIFRHRERGADAVASAVLGAQEVQGAIAASTLTTISVFLPIVYVQGVAGELFGALALAVTFSLLASLLVAVTLLPMLASRWAGAPQQAGPPRAAAIAGNGRVRPGWTRLPRRGLDAADRRFAAFATRYEALLGRALERRGRVALLCGALLTSAALVAAVLPRGVLPTVDQGEFTVRLELPRGTPLGVTAAEAARVEAILAADPAVYGVFARIGRQEAPGGLDLDETGLHTARLDVRLREGDSTSRAVHRAREALGPSAEEGGALAFDAGRATAIGRMLGGGEADLAVRVRGDDLLRALEHARAIEARLAVSDALANVRLGTELGQPEVRVEIDRDRAASFGIEPRRVAALIEGAMRGREATQFADFDRRVPVVVRLPEPARMSLATLDELRIDGVPVRSLVRLDQGFGPAEIRRLEQARVVPVLADVGAGRLDRALREAEGAIAGLPAPPGLRVEVGGENEEMRRSFRDLGFAFALAMLLVFMILAAQFESLVHPFAILLSVPLALVGAIAALAVTGGGLNTMSLIGIVILVGIVVNDAIIKVDLINRLRLAGAPLRAAIVEAGRARLRPIVMTTTTTALGLLPMAMGIGRGAELRAPLAIAVIGGLVVATLLTLVVVPVAYDLLDEAGRRLRRAASPADSDEAVVGYAGSRGGPALPRPAPAGAASER